MRSLVLLLVACGSNTAPPGLALSADAAIAIDASVKPGFDPKPIATNWPDGCFVLRDATGTLHDSNRDRCAMPRRAFSTFKLANALIAVDAGVLAGADSAMTWDKKRIKDES